NAAGPDHVTIIVSQKKDRSFLTHAFEDLLGLPFDLLSSSKPDSARINRSMSAVEAEVIRSVNEAVFKPNSGSWPVYSNVIQQGAVRTILESRRPGRGEL